MSQKLLCLQAYKAMYHFFNMIYFQTYDEFLSDILSAGTLYSEKNEPQTIDPAIWYDWIQSVKIIMQDNTLSYNTIELTTEQAYKVMQQYLVIYCNMGAAASIIALRDIIAADSNQSLITTWFYKKWLESIVFIKNDANNEKKGFLFTAESPLDEESSFRIMQIFLDNYCQKYPTKNLITLVKQSRIKEYNNQESYRILPIWNVWQKAIQEVIKNKDNKTLNLLDAFKAMNSFLIYYSNNNEIAELNKISANFAINQDHKPVNFYFWEKWTDAAVQLYALYTEKSYHIISIKKIISLHVARTIIQTWFEYYHDTINDNKTEKFIFNQSAFDQAISTIQQRQRSYLLDDNEVTVLEAYHVMLELLKSEKRDIQLFEIDEQQNNKPRNFIILLKWIMITENVIQTNSKR